MKRQFLLMLILAVLVFSAHEGRAGTWTTNNFIYKPALGASGATEKNTFDSGMNRVDARLGKETWVGDPNYGSTLQAAVTAIGSASVILRVPAGTHSIAADLTIPANITLRVERGATLAIADGITLTLNGGLEAGLYPIFSCTGTGKAVLGSGVIREAYPQWWGATDWTTSFQKCADALATCGRGIFGEARNTGGVLKLAPGYYGPLTATITLYEGMTVQGSGREVTYIESSVDGFAFEYMTPTTGYDREGPKFRDFSLAAKNGIRLNRPSECFSAVTANRKVILNALVENCFISRYGGAGTGYGVQWSLCFDSHIEKSLITNFSHPVDLHGCDISSVRRNRLNGGQVQVGHNAGFDVEGLSRANPCVVTWTGHGLSTGDKVYLAGVSPSTPFYQWWGLNGTVWTITKINDDSFSIPVNTSGYDNAYDPETDPGRVLYDYWCGNHLVVEHNDMLALFAGAAAYVVAGDSEIRIRDNYMESTVVQGSTLESYVKLLRGMGSFYFQNNRLNTETACLTVGSLDFRWMDFATGPATMIYITNNTNSGLPDYAPLPCVFPYHNWLYNYYNFQGVRRKFVHIGNPMEIEGSLPYNSVDQLTYPAAFMGSLDMPGLTNTAGARNAKPYERSFEIDPNATKDNSLLQWLHTGVNGTVSIGVLAKAGGAGQKIKVERLNGEVSQATVEQALTTSWAWYKVFAGVAVTDLGINVWNEDTAGGNSAQIKRVVVTYD